MNLELACEITLPTPAKRPKTLILVILAQKGPKWPKTEISQMAPMDSKPSQMVSYRSKLTPKINRQQTKLWFHNLKIFKMKRALSE